jgi:hypothetical protein
MEERRFKEAELLVRLIQIGQEGSVRPDLGSSSNSNGVCNSTGIVRDAGYCKDHLKNIWSLLGTERYFNYNTAVVKI